MVLPRSLTKQKYLLVNEKKLGSEKKLGCSVARLYKYGNKTLSEYFDGCITQS